MSSRLVLLAVAATGCSSAYADWDRSQPTPYQCDALVPAYQTPTTDPAIVAPWRALAGRDLLDDAAWLAQVKVAVAKPVPDLTIEERVRVQHELVRIARRLDRMRRDGALRGEAGRVHGRVLALVRSTAPTVAQLATLGASSHPAVNAILGPSVDIAERATKTCAGGNSIHVIHNGGTLAFRPLRSGTTRALVAQLVAYDPAGTPHITPLVDHMELRLGNEVSAPACVVHSGDDGVLRPTAHASIEQHQPFVLRDGTGVGCKRCHGSDNTMRARDLTALELPEIDRARDRQVERLATGLWTALTEDVPATVHE